jgi:hypothetical protein
MMLRTRLRFRPNLRRSVFWVALSVMLISALTGLIWAVIEREFGRGPISVLGVGLGALLVALAFGLLEFTNPTFHPESHLFDWTDVDSLRELERRGQLPEPTREFVRSLADRIAVVLPGRPAPAQGQSQPKTPAGRRP